MNLREKARNRRQLARLNVDVIEAGFPVITATAILPLSRPLPGKSKPVICGWPVAYRAIIDAPGTPSSLPASVGPHPCFLGTSKIHRDIQLTRRSKEILRLAVDSVSGPEPLSADVEFLAGGCVAHRAGFFLVQVCRAVVAAGADHGEYSRYCWLGRSRPVWGRSPASLRFRPGISIRPGHYQRPLPQ